MIQFECIITKFQKQGEKTGWTYLKIPVEVTDQLKPGHKKSFRVKGKLDSYAFSAIALIPMGGGEFIMPLNAAFRKGTGKKTGAVVQVQLAVDEVGYQLNKNFLVCLEDEPAALAYFNTLPKGHQNYFSKWIDEAKTEPTRVKRIAMAVTALSQKMGYAEMIRAQKKDSALLGW